MCPWAWRNWLSVGSTSSRFAAPPFLPSHLWYNVPRAFIFEDKPCDVSLGSEPSLQAGSLYAYGIIKGWEKCVRISRERRREALV